ncbi:hypothetical protein IVB02_03300 [Bradyrhizobium sp. 166]|uniref:hypothetical protein n=1 Tax=Bradyrhizobium sp. 166 TaxID=2782638 RepID=UPI001FF7F673|nr:hypothetical protein [Bradyrhizobium sp. 166]MCK1600473.1 hypothetical protein [Bradyrhizobium sp. 166]
MTRLLNHPQVQPLPSDEHFSVHGTLIQTWASKSFPAAATMMTAPTFKETSARTTPCQHQRPGQQLLSQGGRTEAKLCYIGHATMENRHGLAVAGRVTHGNGTVERQLRRPC